MSKSKDAAPPLQDHATIADVPTNELEARCNRIVALLDKIDAEMDDGVEYDDDSRTHAHRLRGEPEQRALTSVLDYADERPESFKGLANRDGGHDPARFETGLLRHRLANAALLTKLADRFDQSRLLIADSALHVTTLVKPPVLAAYELAKPLAAVDDQSGKKLNPARNFYGGMGRAGARTRKAKRLATEQSEKK